MTKRKPKEITLNTLGFCAVNGEMTRQHRPAELITLLAAHGGQMKKSVLEMALYGGEACASALSTQVLRARALGVTIEFSALNQLYTLKTPVRIDALEFLQLLAEEKFLEAAQLYQGAFLHTSHSHYAQEMRSYLEEQFVQGALKSGDIHVLKKAAMHIWPDARLEEALQQFPSIPLMEVLLRAQLKSVKVA